ncbi:hypothetical protein Goshw_002840 [Gossypium schwendimanii]|uniref:RNase H type-1 domain-containing protein n=1 Tax=Gossypium schwendimanii TaxID=34291 RepID=A0A7J9LT35_GOSSC|nr:hypothetical protein [Gossypium schwendimanii]
MSNNKATIGRVVRGSSKSWFTGFDMVTRVSDIFQIEAWMIVEGLKLVWSKGFNQVVVDCDNAFRHILKGSNKMADYLAKVAVGHYSHRSTIVFKKTTRGGCS